jgi:thermitase
VNTSKKQIAAAAVIALSSWAGTASPQEAAAGAFAAGRILVMPNAGMPTEEVDKALKGLGGKGRKVGGSNLYVVDVPRGSEQAIANKLKHNPHFKFAELDMRVPEDATSNDPYLSSQWHLPKIGATTAWDNTLGTGVTIAILDSGVDTKHPDFSGRLVAGYNFVDGNTNVEDVRSHGTKVAGAAAAALNNGLGVASVAGGAKIMPVRVSDSSGYVYWSNMAAGLTWAADRGAKVAVMSFNGVAGSSSVLSAAKYLKDRGGLSFVSAGNDNIDPGYAHTSSMIIVAATTSGDAKASFSNFGDHVHLSAPGSGIYSTNWGQTYASVSGTSFSAPIAGAVAALVMSANPGLTNTQVENILFSTATDLGSAGRDVYFGYGRVDAAAAVAAALKATSTSTAPTADTTKPSVAIAAPLASSTVSGLVPVSVSATDNVGVTKVELRVNGALLASDTSAPYSFSWDSKLAANGMSTLIATAYDAAGNAASSSSVSVNVSNTTTVVGDTTPPVVVIKNPLNGSKVGNTVKVSVSATDNGGSTALRQSLYINGALVASTTGGSLSYGWNTRRIASGTYKVEARASDAAGNTTVTAVSVYR